MRAQRALVLMTMCVTSIMLIGCGGESAPPPGSSTATGTASSTPGVSFAPSPLANSTVEPLATYTSLESWTSTQLLLLAGIDAETRSTCGPATRLPEGAEDGVECHPPNVQLMGFYRFHDHEEMNALYFERLRQYDVEPDSAGCEDGRPGEAVDVPGLPGFELRVGCYVDENGLANVRIAQPPDHDGGISVYIGVVGLDGDIATLLDRLFPNHHSGAGCGWCADLWTEP